VLIGGLMSILFFIWMLALIWKQSIVLAVASFFLWPVLLYVLMKNWGEEEGDIRVPFALWVVATAYAWYDMLQTAKAIEELQGEQQSLLTLMQSFA
jgi:hypothetical protein